MLVQEQVLLKGIEFFFILPGFHFANVLLNGSSKMPTYNTRKSSERGEWIRVAQARPAEVEKSVWPGLWAARIWAANRSICR